MTRDRRGPVIAGVWLIGLGVVFLVQRGLGLGWSEAWPLFVILAGVATFIRTALDGVRGVGGVWAFTWPVLWIAVGVVLLASTTGRLGQEPLDLIAQWWPIVLVVLGAWFILGAIVPTGGAQERLVVPLDGAREAAVRIRFGAGHLQTRAAAPGNLVDGIFEGGVVRRDRGRGSVELAQDTTYGVPWLDRRSDWTVGLAADVPLDLRFDTGAARAMLDLSELHVRSIELHTGASETRIRLPRAAGATSVRAESGAASLAIEVPTGVAARIRTRMALGSSQIDQAAFPRTADGYESPGYANATNRADIDISGGVGSVRVMTVV